MPDNPFYGHHSQDFSILFIQKKKLKKRKKNHKNNIKNTEISYNYHFCYVGYFRINDNIFDVLLKFHLRSKKKIINFNKIYFYTKKNGTFNTFRWRCGLIDYYGVPNASKCFKIDEIIFSKYFSSIDHCKIKKIKLNQSYCVVFLYIILPLICFMLHVLRSFNVLQSKLCFIIGFLFNVTHIYDRFYISCYVYYKQCYVSCYACYDQYNISCYVCYK